MASQTGYNWVSNQPVTSNVNHEHCKCLMRKQARGMIHLSSLAVAHPWAWESQLQEYLYYFGILVQYDKLTSVVWPVFIFLHYRTSVAQYCFLWPCGSCGELVYAHVLRQNVVLGYNNLSRNCEYFRNAGCTCNGFRTQIFFFRNSVKFHDCHACECFRIAWLSRNLETHGNPVFKDRGW